MNYESLVQNLLNAVPEVQPLYEEELTWWDEILPHIVFGDVLNLYLNQLLKENENREQIASIFEFLEKMAICHDEKVQEVLSVTVLERLGGETEVLATARHFMGSVTKRMSDEVEKGWEEFGKRLKENRGNS